MRNGSLRLAGAFSALLVGACVGPAARPQGGGSPAPEAGAAPSREAASPRDPADLRPAPPAALAALTPEKAVRFRRISRLRFSPRADRVACVVTEVKGPAMESHVWMGDLRTGELRPFTSSPKSDFAPEWSPDGRRLAFLSSRGGKTQIYVMPEGGGEASAVTDAERGVSAFHWSPDGARIAFLAQAGADAKADDAKVADDDRDLDRLWVIDVGTRAARQVTMDRLRLDDFAWASADRLVVSATPAPERETWHGALYDVRAADGRVTLLATPPQPFEGLTLSPKRTKLGFLAPREQGPIAHDLFVQSASGGGAADVTRGIDRRVVEVRWQDETTMFAAVEDGFRTVIHRIGPNGAAPIDLPLSLRTFDVAPDGTLAFVAAGFDRRAELYVRRASGDVRQLGHVQPEWDGVALAAPEIFRTNSFDGTSIEAALFAPSPQPGAPKKLPLVLLVHGGPSSRFAAEYYWFGAWPQLLVARGYQVLLVNPRGSTGYGEAFVKANRGDWGGGDYKDLVAVLDAVVARGRTDPARLGIGGWSYGAEMAMWAIGHTDRFKAAVAGAGVFDQAAEYGTEDDPAGDAWHFGNPWENADVFAKNSPSTFIRNARTPTLMLHGDADRNNPVGQSKALYRALKHFGVETELVIYPGEGHGFRQEKHQVDALARMLAWFDRHLG
jgi:dipeptidyl aminopeptidase/acylaminoacyl peptidase